MPIIISQDGKNARRIERSTIEKEGYLQRYIYDNPESIPLYEINEDTRLLILAREFPTYSGSIDAIGIDKGGQIYIIETKLYRNPDKRTVVAQALDYGAALWKHTNDYNKFLSLLNENVQRTFNLSLEQKVQEYFGISEDEINQLLETIKSNLNDGVFHFVILMDNLDDRLKDLILYVNQNSEFDIYAVELEYYKYESNEIIIPRIFGSEVRKDISPKKAGKQWNWDLFEEKLSALGNNEVTAAKLIIDWAGKNSINIEWSSSLSGAFRLGFPADSRKRFFPFSFTGEGMISWNAPHQGNFSPPPFDNPANRIEILKRLQSIESAKVIINNVEGYSGFRLPLHAIANEVDRQKFFSVCSWIKEALKTKQI